MGKSDKPLEGWEYTWANDAKIIAGLMDQCAYTKTEALAAYRRTADAARRPFIYLSAGVDNKQFTESLRWAAEADVNFSGVLCGRATWKDGIAVHAKHGAVALQDWLMKTGVRNYSGGK